MDIVVVKKRNMYIKMVKALKSISSTFRIPHTTGEFFGFFFFSTYFRITKKSPQN